MSLSMLLSGSYILSAVPKGSVFESYCTEEESKLGNTKSCWPFSQKTERRDTTRSYTSVGHSRWDGDFGNIATWAGVLSRRGESLPSLTHPAAMHGSSNERGSHIFWVAYSDLLQIWEEWDCQAERPAFPPQRDQENSSGGQGSPSPCRDLNALKQPPTDSCAHSAKAPA